MADYQELVSILKEILTNRFYPMPAFTRGLLGDGNGNVEVPGRPDYNYVRFSRTTDTTFQVFNKEVSQPVDNWPVLIGELPWQPGLVQVVATDWNAYIQTGWGNNVASIQTHAPTHEWPTFAPGSDAVNVYPRALTPLRTQSVGSGSNAVFVNPYEYDWTGTNAQWPGVPAMDFSAKPPTGSMLYMGIYLNPTTNALGVVSGSTTVFTDALEPALPNWPLGVFPSGYVRLYGGQAMITERDIRPAQRLYGSTMIFTGTSSGVGGGWPFAQVLTVSTTNINADYPTLAAAAAVANNQTILLDSETYMITGQSLPNTITLTGVLGQTVISGSVASGATLTIANISTFLRFLRVSHTGGGTTSGAVLTDQDGTFLERLIIRKTAGAPTTGYGVHITGGASSGTYLLNNDISVTSGTSRYGVLIDTAASITVIDGGEYNSTTADILVNHAGAVVLLKGPRLRGGGLTVTAGTVTGWYIDASGFTVNVTGLNFDVTKGLQGGVWREATGGRRVRETSLATAITNASAGDAIRHYPGTTAAAQTVNKAVSILGSSAKEAILTQSTNDINTVTITAAGVTLENLTIDNTGGGSSASAIYNDQAGFIATRCIISKSAGAPTNGATLNINGGTSVFNQCIVSSASGTSKYGFSVAAGTVTINGGSVSGATADVLTVTGATVILNGPQLLGGGINTGSGGTVTGWYIDTSGITYTSIENNVWHAVNFDLNYIITPSVASNDLTVALKTLSGNDPTAANRLSFKIGSTWRDVTAALTFTKNDGTNWMGLGGATTAGVDTDVFVYVIQETGASAGTKLGISRIPYARVMGDFVNTTTNQRYIAGSWTNFNSTDEVALIGRFNVALSATAAFNWSLPTQVVINRPIYETRRLSYTAVATSQTGTITSVTALGTYQFTGNSLFIANDVTVTTAGTGAGALIVTIPLALVADSAFAFGRENAVTGASLSGRCNAADIRWLRYDNVTIIANGAVVKGSVPGLLIS